MGNIKAKVLLIYKGLHCDMGDDGEHKDESLGLLELGCKREICFGDEAADGSTSFKATKQITPL